MIKPGSTEPETFTVTRCTSSSDTRRWVPTICSTRQRSKDPNVFTRPWTISLPLYRRMERNVELMEFKCVELVEEKIYGHLRKQEEE